MRSGSILFLVMAAALGIAITAHAQDADVATYPNYGFSIALPTPREPISLDLGQINGMVDSYKANNLVYVVFATDDIQPKDATARQALNMMGSITAAAASKMPETGFHSLSGSNAQGSAAAGFGARVAKTMAARVGKSAMDWATAVPAQLRAMFGDDMYQAVLMVPTTETGRMIVGIGVVGPGGQSAQVDAEAVRVMHTLSIGNKSSAAPTTVTITPAATTLKSLSRLKKGQIELIGTVISIDKPGKSLNMMVSQVTSYGQSTVALSPARSKKVFMKAIPADVKDGCKIVVVAADSGVGKPVTAESVRVIEPGEAK